MAESTDEKSALFLGRQPSLARNPREGEKNGWGRGGLRASSKSVKCNSPVFPRRAPRHNTRPQCERQRCFQGYRRTGRKKCICRYPDYSIHGQSPASPFTHEKNLSSETGISIERNCFFFHFTKNECSSIFLFTKIPRYLRLSSFLSLSFYGDR